MSFLNKFQCAIASATLLISAQADTLAARHQSFVTLANQFNIALKPMLNGDAAFDKAVFEKNAAKLSDYATQPWQFFPATAEQGMGKSQETVWSKPDDFKTAIQKFEASTQVLAEAAKSGDLSRIKPAFDDVGANCRSCHAVFKQK